MLADGQLQERAETCTQQEQAKSGTALLAAAWPSARSMPHEDTDASHPAIHVSGTCASDDANSAAATAATPLVAAAPPLPVLPLAQPSPTATRAFVLPCDMRYPNFKPPTGASPSWPGWKPFKRGQWVKDEVTGKEVYIPSTWELFCSKLRQRPAALAAQQAEWNRRDEETRKRLADCTNILYHPVYFVGLHLLAEEVFKVANGMMPAKVAHANAVQRDKEEKAAAAARGDAPSSRGERLTRCCRKWCISEVLFLMRWCISCADTVSQGAMTDP